MCGPDDQLLCSKLRTISWFWGGSGARTGWYIAVLAAANGRWLLGFGINKRLVAFENWYVHPGQLVCQQFRVIDVERRESIGGISHEPKQFFWSTLPGWRPAKQIQHCLEVPWITYVLARVEETLLESRRNIVVDVHYCSVTSTIIDVFGVRVQRLIAVASQLAVQSSYVVPAGRATSCQLIYGF